MLPIVFCFIILLLHDAEGARILFASMPNDKSHIGSMAPMAKRLLADKHEVAAYLEVEEPLALPPGVVSEQILLRNADIIDAHQSESFTELLWYDDLSPSGLIAPWTHSIECTKHVLDNQPDDFWRVANQTWDLVLVDGLFTAGGITQAYVSKGPHAVFDTSSIESYMGYFRGLGWTIGASPPMYVLLDYFGHNPKMKIRSNLIPAFSWAHYAQTSSMSFSDALETLEWPMPRSNQIVFVGSHCPPADTFKALPPDLETFVGDPKSKGTILLAFGTVVDWSRAPKDKVDAVFGALKELKDYRIIWQFKDAQFELPAHIITMNWVPQPDILNHPKTKLFVSHGGLKSLKETVCASKPAVFLPLFAEQVRNALGANQAGFGGFLNKNLLTKDYVLAEILKILQDDSYKKNVQRIRSLWLDKVADSLDVGAFWVNKIVKFGGLPPKYFRPKPKRYLFQGLNLDLFCVFVFFVIASVKFYLRRLR